MQIINTTYYKSVSYGTRDNNRLDKKGDGEVW